MKCEQHFEETVFQLARSPTLGRGNEPYGRGSLLQSAVQKEDDVDQSSQLIPHDNGTLWRNPFHGLRDGDLAAVAATA